MHHTKSLLPLLPLALPVLSAQCLLAGEARVSVGWDSLPFPCCPPQVLELEGLPRAVSRAAYTHRILEIVSNIRKQKEEIKRVRGGEGSAGGSPQPWWGREGVLFCAPPPPPLATVKGVYLPEGWAGEEEGSTERCGRGAWGRRWELKMWGRGLGKGWGLQAPEGVQGRAWLGGAKWGGLGQVGGVWDGEGPGMFWGPPERGEGRTLVPGGCSF